MFVTREQAKSLAKESIEADNLRLAIAWLHIAIEHDRSSRPKMASVAVHRKGHMCRHGYATYWIGLERYHSATGGLCSERGDSPESVRIEA